MSCISTIFELEFQKPFFCFSESISEEQTHSQTACDCKLIVHIWYFVCIKDYKTTATEMRLETGQGVCEWMTVNSNSSIETITCYS